MTAPDFDPQRLTIEELLGGQRYYEIPRFQRPYSWDRANWDDFWRDVFEDNDEGYFIGPMVGFRRGRSGPAVAIVDGQQRLTTITLLLAVIRDCLAEAGEASLAEGVHRFIERPDRDNLARFVIQPEERSAYLNEGILQQSPDRTSSPKVQGDQGLRAAFGDLRSKVEDTLKGPRGGALTKPARTAKLKSLRDRLLSLRVIWIDHANEDDAYVVFETLNSRGKDLETVDLLKNLLLSKLRTSNKQADTARSKWNAFRSVLQESSPSIPADRFILHWWLSREKYVGQKQLYRRIKEQVRTEKEAERQLTQLGADVRLYRVIFEPTVRGWGPEESPIREPLEALAIFGVVQPAPLLLAMLRCRDEGKPRIGPLALTFRAIENFHFQSTAVAGQSSSGGISERYAKYAREITSARSAQARTLKLKEFREAMAMSLPDRELFLTGFTELALTDELTRDKKLVQYILRRMHSAQFNHVPTNPTVEHLLPQDTISDNTSARLVGCLGNLLWVDGKTNAELANKTFTQKKRILEKKRKLLAIEGILDCAVWGATEIEARGRMLADKALDEVWKYT